MMKLLQVTLEKQVTSQSLVLALAEWAPEVALDHIEELALLLEPFLRSMPQALSLAIQMTKDRGCGRAVAFATGQVLDYVFDEDDLLPEQDFGTLGLLDDAYILHTYAGMLSRMYPHVDTSSVGYQPPDQRTLHVVRSLLPAGIANALDRTCDNLVHLASALFGSGGGEEGSYPRVPPVLRVGEAVLAISVTVTLRQETGTSETPNQGMHPAAPKPGGG